MVQSIVRQSVIIKCKIKKSPLLGNYEFFYAAGLFSKISGTTFPCDVAPDALKEAVTEALPLYEPKNEEERYLMKALNEYRPGPEKDEDMEALFAAGCEEKRIWEVSV